MQAWTEDQRQVIELDLNRLRVEVDHAKLNSKTKVSVSSIEVEGSTCLSVCYLEYLQ